MCVFRAYGSRVHSCGVGGCVWVQIRPSNMEPKSLSVAITVIDTLPFKSHLVLSNHASINRTIPYYTFMHSTCKKHSISVLTISNEVQVLYCSVAIYRVLSSVHITYETPTHTNIQTLHTFCNAYYIVILLAVTVAALMKAFIWIRCHRTILLIVRASNE